MTTKIVLLTSSFDWESVELDRFDDVLTLENGTEDLVKRAQEEKFNKEIKKIQKKKQVKKNSRLLSLTPILGKDGLLRVGGRIDRAPVPYENRHPIILPAKHPLTRKIIRIYHRHLKHCGTDYVLAHLRQQFWVINGREEVKRIGRECPECRRERAKPAGQLMGDLPDVRLDMLTPPFNRTAVDFFGPLQVSLGRNRTAKRYGVIFTCLVTRAVFLELAQSLSTPDFLMVMRRFMGLYGKPRSINSDNGTNFVGTERELRQSLDELANSEALKKMTQEEGIRWHFQPPRAPHFGGAHESLVKSTKRALYRAVQLEEIRSRFPTEEQLRTLLFEVSGLLNGRPLGYVSSDPKDPRPLTPNDFLNRPSTSSNPHGGARDALPADRHHYTQKLTNLFWDIWKKDYLQSLITRKKWQKRERNMEVGDIVLLVEKNIARGQWNTGSVMKTYPGLDKLVRVVDVKTSDGIYKRAIHTLCLLTPIEEETGSSPEVGNTVSGGV